MFPAESAQGGAVQQVFFSSDVSQMAGVSLRQLQWWDERKLVTPRKKDHRRLYTPQQVLEILTAGELRRKGLSLQKIRRVLRAPARTQSALRRGSRVLSQVVCTDGRPARVSGRAAGTGSGSPGRSRHCHVPGLLERSDSPDPGAQCAPHIHPAAFAFLRPAQPDLSFLQNFYNSAITFPAARRSINRTGVGNGIACRRSEFAATLSGPASFCRFPGTVCSAGWQAVGIAKEGIRSVGSVGSERGPSSATPVLAIPRVGV
jgi:DNA-binding transcriptional MerR regulator